MKNYVVAVSVALLAGQVGAYEGDMGWQPRFDLLTAGAAAAVIVNHLCVGASASRAAADMAAVRLQSEAQSTGQAHAAQAYAVESYRLKLRAFEMSTEGLGCHQLGRLVNIAASQGFSTPGR